MTNQRKLSAYEINHLIKHNRWPIELSELGTKPVEYVTGRAEFLQREFKVTPATLIPRLETEELVDLVVNYILRSSTPSQITTLADIGTGSGCLGISITLELMQMRPLRLILSDISSPAIEVARDNAQALLPTDFHPIFIQSDLLLDYPDSLQPDIIVANLPYIPSEHMESLDESVKDHEPHGALEGGDKGLALIKQLIEQAQKMPVLPSAIFLEIDEFVTRKDWGFCTKYNVKLITDQFDKVRFAQLERI